jgi:hypothetical protein
MIAVSFTSPGHPVMPPKISAAEAEVLPFAVAAAPLPAPSYLTEEQQADWRALIEPFAPGRFKPDQVPVLVELMRAQSRARQVNEQLATLRKRDLIADTKGGRERRAIYIQLREMADAETRLISSLSTKLRLVDQSNVRKALASAEREKMATGPRPWDDWRHDKSGGQH